MIRIIACAAIAVATFAAVPAFAHATLEVQKAEIGKGYKAVLRVPHGCGTEATNVVRVQIPEGFYNVKPMPKGRLDAGNGHRRLRQGLRQPRHRAHRGREGNRLEGRQPAQRVV